MKQSILDKLETFKRELLLLKKEVSDVKGTTINRIGIRTRADAVATMWVEELRSSLEHKFQLPKDLIDKTAAEMKQLHVLSRPSNLKTSYLKTVNATLTKFDDKFTLPIKQSATEVESIIDSVTNLSELQTVFDTDLLVVLEGLNLIDGNQSERLRTCFQYRNHSAHPGGAPIEDAHVIAFFTDINAIVLQNPTFNP